MGIRGELYTNQVQVNNRSYFFNVKENRNGDVFLQIVESKISDGQDDRRAIVVFSDNMKDFLSGLDDSLQFIEKNRKEQAKLKAERKAAKDAKYRALAAEERGDRQTESSVQEKSCTLSLSVLLQKTRAPLHRQLRLQITSTNS